MTPTIAADKTIIWASSDTKVASVSSTGSVKALRDGKATITAKSKSNPDVMDNCSIIIPLNESKITKKNCKKSGKKLKNTIEWKEVKYATKYLVQRSLTETGPYTTRKTQTKKIYSEKVNAKSVYYYRIIAVSSTNGCNSTSKAVQINAIQSPKIKNTIYKIKSKKPQITVIWGKVANAAGYKIYRKDGNNAYIEIKNIKGNKKFKYIDKNIKTGISYKYKVTSYFSKNGSIMESDQSSAHTTVLIAFRWPVKDAKSVSSKYGYRIDPILKTKKYHSGIDIRCPYQTKVKAAESGVVSFSGTKSGYGNCVIIEHKDGFSTLYGHNDSNNVTVGNKVKKGAIVAFADSTGRSTGNHLHFEIIKKGKKQDPLLYLP